MAAFNLKQYVKNVSRSAGYVITETAKELNPTIAEFAETNGDALKEMYSAVRDYKKILREGKEAVANSEYRQIAKETVSNFLDDLKTGNFYNKERVKKNEMSFGFDTGDFDFDDWNNIDENWGEGSSDDDSLTFGAMDTIGQKMSMASGKAAMASADYVVKAGRANTKTILAHTDLMFGKVNTSLSVINSTIASVGKASVESAATHYNNSTKFYTTATEELAKQTGYLTQIYDLLKDRFTPKEKQSSQLKNRYGSVVSYDGIPDVKEYMGLVKENLRESTWISAATSILGTLSAFEGGIPQMLRSALASPISSLMKIGTSGTVRSILGKDFEKFNKTLSGAFGSLMVKTNKKANNGGIAGFLAEIFGIKPDSKKSIDTGKYEKGRVDWNGKDEKALREVIPTQLALILSAITGQDAKIYNYETGKWTTYKQLQKNLKKDVKNISRRATSDIQGQFEDYFLDDNKNSGISRSSKAFHTFKQDSQNFFHYLTMNNDMIPFNDREWDKLESRLDKFGLLVDNGSSGSGGLMLRSNFNRIRQYYKRNEKNGKRHININTPGQMLSGRNEIAQFMQNQENDPASMYGMLFSGVDKKGGFGSKGDKNLPKIKNHFLNSMVDNKGNNIFYYLQQFYMDLKRVEYNTRTGGGSGSNETRKRKNVYIPNRSKKIASKNVSAENDRFVDIDDGDALKHSGIREDKKTEAQILEEKFKKAAEEFANAPLAKLGKPGQFLQNMLSIPAAKISTMIDNADKNIYNLFYGETSDKPGIFAKMVQGFDDTFAKIKASVHSAIHDTFAPMATLIGDKIAGAFGFSSFKDMMKEGVLNSNFIQGVKDNLKGAWNWSKSGVKEAVSSTGDFFTGGMFTPKMKEVIGAVKGFGKNRETVQAAHGGMVTKSGMISVSEGELIIPSEHNPFYSKRTNKSAQITKEKNTASKYKAIGGGNYWGNYANGGTVHDTYQKIKKTTKDAEETVKNAKSYIRVTIEDAKDNAGVIINDIRSTEGYKKVSSAYDKVSAYLLERGLDVADRLFGKNNDKDGHVIDKDTRRENTRNTIASGWGEIKSSSKHIAAGGIIGAGVSAIGGLVGGPIIGAAIGAATGLTIGSKRFQQTLFGTDITDENGDVIGHKYGTGILGKRTAEFLEKRFPEMAKFGLAGGIGGMLGVLPGGTVGGMMIGSAINFAMQNETFKNYLFGEEGIFGENGEEKIKKVLPKMGIGAAIGAFTGPFGLVGNMMLGGAIGLYTDTEKFKQALFGIEDSDGNLQGGLLGVARDQVIDPMKNYFKGGMQKFEDHMKEYVFNPIANLLRPIGDILDSTIHKGVDFLQGQIKDHVVDPIAKKISDFFKPFTKLAGKLGKGAINLAGSILKLGGGTLNELGQEIDYSNIRKGRARSLSAEERYQYQTDFALRNANYKTKAYDEFAATADYETLRKNKDLLDLYEKTKNNAVAGSRDIKQNLYNKITADTGFSASGKESKLIRNAFNKYAKDGDMTHVKATIQMLVGNGKLSKEQADRLLKQAEETQVRLQEIKSGNLDSMEKEAEDVAKSMGFKGLSDIDNKTKRLLASDIYNKKRELDSDKKEEKKADESPLGAITLSEKDHNILDSILHPIQEIKYLHDKSVVYLNDIRNGIFKLAKIDIPTNDIIEGDSKKNKAATKDLIEKNKEEVAATQAKFKHVPMAEDLTGTDENVITNIDQYGNVARYINDGKGNFELDLRDSGSKNAAKDQEEEKSLRHKFYSNMIGFKNTLVDIFLAKNEDEEDKKGLLHGIFDDIKSIGSNIWSMAMNIGGLILGAGKLGIIASILVNLFGNEDAKKSLHNIENAATNRRTDEEYEATGDQRDEYLSDRAFGHSAKNLILKGQKTFIPGSKYFLRTRKKVIEFGKNHGKQIFDKTIDLAKTGATTLSNSKVAKFATEKFAQTKIGQKVVTKIAEGGGVKKVVANIGYKALGKITNTTAGVFAYKAGAAALENITKLKKGIVEKFVLVITSAFKFIKPGANKIIKPLAEKLGKEAAEEASKKGLKSVGGKLLKSIVAPVNLVFAAGAALNGWKNANFILEIIEKPSIGERFMSAVVNGINELIPGIGGIIPSQFIIKLLLGFLKAINKAPEGLMEKRRKAQEELAEWNEENPDQRYGSVSEYLRGQKGMSDNGIISSLGKGAIKIATKVVKAPFNGLKKVANIISGGRLFNENDKKEEEQAETPDLANSGASELRSMEQKVIRYNNPSNYQIPQANTYYSTNPKTIPQSYNKPIVINSPTRMVGGSSGIITPVSSIVDIATSRLDDTIGKLTVPNFQSIFDEMLKYMDPEKKKDTNGLINTISKIQQIGENSTVGELMGSVMTKMIGSLMLPTVTTFRSMNILGNILTGKTYATGEARDVSKQIENDTKKGGFLKKVGTWFTGLFKPNTTTREELVGSGSGVHVSQKDPSYANKKFGKSTIGESGCGPAVAATILGQYGKNTSIDQTAGYALAKGYVAGSSGVKGTRASYFSDILGKNGISSRYTSDRQDIKKAIGSGKPTILLGQNPSNRTKTNSPFGPNPHYVVAQGTRDGRVIVNDPELGRPALYKNNILNNTKLGIMTGGDSALKATASLTNDNTNSPSNNSNPSVPSGGNISTYTGQVPVPTSTQTETTNGNVSTYTGQKAVDGNTNQAKVYQFFTQNGLSPEATIGMMGNIEQESGFKPAMIQRNGKGPAAGLFQWENYTNKSKRWAEMNKYAQSKGKLWTDMISQMEYALSEMKNENWIWTTQDPSDYPQAKSFEEFAAMKDPIGAMYAFENAFERAGKPMFENRIKATKKYAEMFMGAKISDPSVYVSSQDGYNISTQSDVSDSTDVGSIIDRALKNVFGGVLSKMGGVGESLSKIFGFSDQDEAQARSIIQDNIAYNTGNIDFTSSKNTKQENAIVGAMQKMFGWMGYSQDTRNDFKPGGWSDCSATVQHAIKTSIGVDPGGDTGAQIVSKNGRTVDVGTGNGPNENNLRPGDLLLYKRAKSEKPKKVGHVEMYMGDGKRAGHGGSKASPYGLDPTGEHGKGPFVSDLAGDRERYIEARRFTNNGDILTDGVGAGSGIIDFTDRRKYSHNDITRIPVSREIRKVTSRINSIGGDSELLSTNNQELLKIMTEYLHIIAQNTTANTNIRTIVEILQSIMNIIPDKATMTQAQPVVINTGSSNQEQSNDTKIEMEMKSIIDKLQQLAQAV